MLIANPIYDVVFNYLMEDLTVAKHLIGKIIAKEIIDLTPSPTTLPIKIARSLHVYRMDYAATIKTTQNKSYKVIIEVQKALVIEDILRFREYLGKQYGRYFIKKPKDKRSTNEEKRLKEKKMTHPIITIYFLGNKLETMTQPIINVKRHYYDAATHERIQGTENFIEQLTHDCHIIQIPYLPRKKRTELEHILTVFDQHYVVNLQSPHRLDIPDEKMSDILRLVARRLIKAQTNTRLEEIMNIEDEHYNLEKKMQLQEKNIQLQKKKIERQEKALKKKDDEIKKEKTEKKKLIAFLKKKGIDYVI